MEEEKISPVQMIVDLFELRASYIELHLEQSKIDRVFYDFQYNSLSVALNLLIDKYKVKQWEIEDEIRKRRETEYKKKFNIE
jgi:hypothetical protein